MKDKYMHESNTVVNICVAIALILIGIGVFCKLYILISLAFIVAFSSNFLKEISSFIEADNEKVCFKIGLIKKEIYYSDIDFKSCEVINDGYFRLTGQQLYAIELRIVKKDGWDFITKSSLDVTTNYILNNRYEFDKRVYNHKLSQLLRYIETQIR